MQHKRQGYFLVNMNPSCRFILATMFFESLHHSRECRLSCVSCVAELFTMPYSGLILLDNYLAQWLRHVLMLEHSWHRLISIVLISYAINLASKDAGNAAIIQRGIKQTPVPGLGLLWLEEQACLIPGERPACLIHQVAERRASKCR